MEFTASKTKLPFINDPDGVIRIGKTRVTLDTIITSFKNGSTCEEIIYEYPVLKLADVYTAISYYLNNQNEAEKYLNEHTNKAKKL